MDGVCKNFNYTSFKEINLGFAENDNQLPYVFLPLISIILNFIVISTYLSHKKFLKGRESLEKMLYILTIVELLISVVWLINGTVFFRGNNVVDYCGLCFFISLATVFIYNYDWIFFCLTIHNLKTLVYDPIEGVKSSNKRIKSYILIAFAESSVLTFLIFAAGIYGLSPMVNCYISSTMDDQSFYRVLSLILFLLIPTVIISYTIYLAVMLIIYIRKHNLKVLYKLLYCYLGYGSIYILNFIPSIVLYYFSINKSFSNYSTTFKWFIYCCSFINISISGMLSIYRICLDLVKFDLYEDKSTASAGGVEEHLLEISEGDSNVFDIERSLTTKVIKELFLGIAYVLNKSIKQKKNLKQLRKTLGQKDFNEEAQSKIVASELSPDELDLLYEEDELKENNFIFTEYAPNAFKVLRFLEGLRDEDILDSLDPKKNKVMIDNSGGRSGSFFISTSDKKYILKTMNEAEIELLKTSFLPHFIPYLEKNKDSIICRFYGVYKLNVGGKDYPIVLMRNIFGGIDFENYRIKAKFDLKGSTVSREEKDESSKATQKDINFNRNEKYIKLEETEAAKFTGIIKKDAEFLDSLKIMDYSLFLIKLELKMDDIVIKHTYSLENGPHHDKTETNTGPFKRKKEGGEDEVIGFKKSNSESIKNPTTALLSAVGKERIREEVKELSEPVGNQENRKSIPKESATVDDQQEQTQIRKSNQAKDSMSIHTESHGSINHPPEALKKAKTQFPAGNEFQSSSNRDLTFDINADHYSKYQFNSDNSNTKYVISIIDFLQLYNAKKYFETVFKSIFVAPTKPDEISSVSPDKYCKRFVKYITSIVYMKTIKAIKEENPEDEEEILYG